MNLEIQKIRLKDLESFVQSETFKQFSIIPITDLRVKSYINNPRAQPNDFVLYLGFVEKQLVAFRTLFADNIKSQNKKVRFAWCSGNWVRPDFRRKGFSERLLQEALNDWNGKLMFTNYAPNSEELYLKSGKFKAIHQFRGFRGYLFPKTRKLVHVARKNNLTKVLFSAVDIVISAFTAVKLWFFTMAENPDIIFETTQFPDEMCFKNNPDNSMKYLCSRGEEELKWIFKYPWISGGEAFVSEKYPFSSWSKSFSYYTIKIIVKNIVVGFFIFSVREGHLKTLYFNLPPGIEKEVAKYLKKFCAEKKIEVVTVYYFQVAQHLFAEKYPFLYAKKYGQKIYSSFEIKENHNYLFQDGDGDVIFT